MTEESKNHSRKRRKRLDLRRKKIPRKGKLAITSNKDSREEWPPEDWFSGLHKEYSKEPTDKAIGILKLLDPPETRSRSNRGNDRSPQ